MDDPRTTAFEAQFLLMLDAAFRRDGAAGLPPRLRAAVAATPRHRFVHRFRVEDGPLRDADADPAPHLPTIYSDAVMRHVDAAGDPLPSSNSQPSYILQLLDMLSVEPGQTVLEIGSGSGWLAAVMARLVGPRGRVVGIELISGLAEQSRADLAALGIGNVQIVTGDGDRGYAPAAPYDRAVVTAAVWDLPLALLDQVAPGGKVLVPVELRGGEGCSVTLFRQEGDALVAERATPGWFVPLLGPRQDRPAPMAAEPPPGERVPLPLGASASIAAQFRAFLGRTEAGFVASAPIDAARRRPGVALPPFGLQNTDGSLALWYAGEIVTSGGPGAASRLARAYERWAALGLPGSAAFQLSIRRAEAAPAPARFRWIERRAATALAWSIRSDLERWRSLLPAV